MWESGKIDGLQGIEGRVCRYFDSSPVTVGKAGEIRSHSGVTLLGAGAFVPGKAGGSSKGT